MGIVIVSGTSTGAGQNVTAAAVAALARARGRTVAVVLPAQTGALPGEPADLAEISQLAPGVATYEYARYRDLLSPDAAARQSGDRPLRLTAVAKSVAALDADFDLVLVVGTGGLLDRYGPDGWTPAELAWSMQAPVLLVTAPGRDAPNFVSLTLEAMKTRGLHVGGVVLTRWPGVPDLADRTSVTDLETILGRPLAGVLPECMPGGDDFLAVARLGLDASWGGRFNAAAFRDHADPTPAGTSVTG